MAHHEPFHRPLSRQTFPLAGKVIIKPISLNRTSFDLEKQDTQSTVRLGKGIFTLADCAAHCSLVDNRHPNDSHYI